MISPTGIIPENLLYPERLSDVVAWLLREPYEGQFKRELLQGWAVATNTRVDSDTFKRVIRSGIDQPGNAAPVA